MDEIVVELQRLLEPYPGVYTMVVVGSLLLLAFLAWLAGRFFLQRGILRLLGSLSRNGGEREVKLVIVPRLAYIVPILILSWGVVAIPGVHETAITIVHNLCSALIIVTIAMALAGVLDLVDDAYHRRADAADKPIKGFLQLGKIVLFVVAAILIISTLVNQNPVILLSGLGAMAAVLMLIFQDTILSAVASIQLGSNDMVHIGDWIEMPAQNADGFVIEVALHTVKVQNWDKTITTVPVRKLITDSFINWRGMFESGGRRIKRSLFIDQRSVRFLDDREIGCLEEFVLLNGYLDRKQKELAVWNGKLQEEGARPINRRRVTNLGTFRAYVEQYLKNHPGIHQEMILLVRQLQPGFTGIPLEIYCFTKETAWVLHEGVQSDIFDHLLAILPTFGLWVYQRSSDAPASVAAFPPVEEE